MSAGTFIKSALRQPALSLGVSALGLLLLVVVLLSVPGPAQGMYWFEMDSPTGNGAMLKAGVMGWCWAGTTNCTYAALSENEYLDSLFDVGSAVTVKALVPLSCYWAIIVVVFWTILTVTAPAGYRIEGTQFLARHLYFNIIEVTVLCMQLFGCILTWLAVGFTNSAFQSLKSDGVSVRSGNAMNTIAVAATISLLGFALGASGLYFRIQEAERVWQEEGEISTIMPDRPLDFKGIENRPGHGIIGQFRASRMSSFSEAEAQTLRPMSKAPGTDEEKSTYNSKQDLAVTEIDGVYEEELKEEPEVLYTQRVRRMSRTEPGSHPVVHNTD